MPEQKSGIGYKCVAIEQLPNGGFGTCGYVALKKYAITEHFLSKHTKKVVIK